MKMDSYTEQWHLNPFLAIFIVGLTYLFYIASGLKKSRRNVCFAALLVLFIIAECSPVHDLGMKYFSVHMIAHVTELLICGSLLMVSMQPENTSMLYNNIKKISVFFAKHSWCAWICGVGVMWYWHIPSVYNSVMNSMRYSFSIIPILHASSMLLAGAVFSWPIFGPFESNRLRPLQGIIYLATACISCSLLGLIITFAPLNTWHMGVTHMPMRHNGTLQLSPVEDQQAAGLIMWVPCCFVYLSGCLFLLYRWFKANDLENDRLTIQLHNVKVHHE